MITEKSIKKLAVIAGIKKDEIIAVHMDIELPYECVFIVFDRRVKGEFYITKETRLYIMQDNGVSIWAGEYPTYGTWERINALDGEYGARGVFFDKSETIEAFLLSLKDSQIRDLRNTLLADISPFIVRIP